MKLKAMMKHQSHVLTWKQSQYFRWNMRCGKEVSIIIRIVQDLFGFFEAIHKVFFYETAWNLVTYFSVDLSVMTKEFEWKKMTTRSWTWTNSVKEKQLQLRQLHTKLNGCINFINKKMIPATKISKRSTKEPLSQQLCNWAPLDERVRR